MEDKKVLEEKIIAVIKTCYDPEIPVNIYDLGMIYKIVIDDEANANIDMTLTSPNCPVAESLPAEVRKKIIDEVKELQSVNLRLVWEPPWNREMLSEEARLELGFF